MNEVAIIRPDMPVSRADWAGAISGAWRKSLEAVLETGRLIREAKDALPHGEFTAMVERELPFGERWAQMLMKIAGHPQLTDPKHASVLPPSPATLYELAKLDEKTFERKLADGTIRPDMQRREVSVRGRAGNGERVQPPGLDFFPTAPFATRALVEVVLPNLGASIEGRVVVDPCCGEGHITGVLAEYDVLAVHGYDIHDYSRTDADGIVREAPGWVGYTSDFLADETEIGTPDWVIMNPPFFDAATETDRPLEFVLKALRIAAEGVAMLVPQRWLEGIDRYERLFAAAPPTLYAQFVERVNICEGHWDPLGSTDRAYCWLVWVRDMAPLPTFWIPPGQRKRFFYADDVERFTSHPVLPPQRDDPLMAEVMAVAAGEVDAADALPSVTEDELVEYKALSAIACGVNVSGEGIEQLRNEGLIWPRDLVLTSEGHQRAQYLHEKVKAATSLDNPDAVRITKAGDHCPDSSAPEDDFAPYDAAIEKLAGRRGRLVMAEAATALRLGRDAGVTPQRLAEDLGHPVGTIKTWLNRLGLTDINRMREINAQRAAEWSAS